MVSPELHARVNRSITSLGETEWKKLYEVGKTEK
jgi:hypothetical protein